MKHRLARSLLLGAVVLFSRAATASPPLESAAPTRAADAGWRDWLRGWDASVRAGYGGVYTVGLSYLGAGWGAAIGYHVRPRLRLEATALSSWGQATRASNDTLSYRAFSESTRATLGIGYDLSLGPLVVRPGVRAGAEFVHDRTSVGPSSVRDDRTYPLVGPCIALLVRLGIVEVGIDGEAFFLPTWPAAPTAGTYGFAGLHF